VTFTRATLGSVTDKKSSCFNALYSRKASGIHLWYDIGNCSL